MKMHFVIILFLLACGSHAQSDLSLVVTSSQAYQFAKDNRWAEVQLVPTEDCKWLMNVERKSEPEDPYPGQSAVVRNSNYKVISDTQMVQIQCAVIDFDTRKMSIEEIDSVRNRMLMEYSRHGSFEQLAKDHLPSDEMYRYQEFSDYTGQIESMLDDSFVSKSKGEIFFHELSRTEDFKFIVLIREDPKEVDGFIVLKARQDG